ncbi:hypothetical protein TIFTF001_042188 [Ficus carica]|uniref:Uncharacterized protein n=1 Tax=Ficus carica TaxID=3494 RepID=A0AA87ZJU0_FICCA|nr:hypothetical protein TIFTF001_042188 [Ficus carica]
MERGERILIWAVEPDGGVGGGRIWAVVDLGEDGLGRELCRNSRSKRRYKAWKAGFPDHKEGFGGGFDGEETDAGDSRRRSGDGVEEGGPGGGGGFLRSQVQNTSRELKEKG